MEPVKTHLLRILDRTGDTRVSYDPADADAVRDVETRFARLMSDSFIAFDVSTQPGRIITRFDPQATEIIVSPRFAGG
jgi:hypothetical protein